MFKNIITLLLCFSNLVMGQQNQYSDGFTIDFESYLDNTPYTNKEAISDFKNLKFWDNLSSVDVKKYKKNNHAMRILIRKDKYSRGSGIISETYLSSQIEYTLEYKVFFEPDFEFNRGNTANGFGGGKLLGLCGGTRPSGGKAKPGGVSARIMFRKDKVSKESYLELYHYWPGQKKIYGDQTFLVNCKAGKWYSIKQTVNVGTKAEEGFVKIWINGKLYHDKKYKYQDVGEQWYLDGAMIHAFMGGNEPIWGPTKDQYIMFDDIRVSK
ncbi:MAG: polysaccharide lyase [Leadbetterella sp.]